MIAFHVSSWWTVGQQGIHVMLLQNKTKLLPLPTVVLGFDGFYQRALLQMSC